jgi:hypothetical protein
LVRSCHDGSKDNIKFIKKDFIYWKYDLTAYHNFITRENINELISKFTNCSDIGLLSIDIDGNDYWIWEAITVIKPRIIVCEYNSAFESRIKCQFLTKPIFPELKLIIQIFILEHHWLHFITLPKKRVMILLGTTGAGVNAFFVRKDLSAPFIKYNAQTGFRPSA